MVANPSLPTYGTDRFVKFQLNAPAQLAVGFGFRPSGNLSVALDAKQIFYEDTEGFKDFLGFRDITVYALGLQYQVNPNFALRLGGNHNDSAIESDRVFFTVPVPAVFEDHVTAGFGMKVTPSLTANLGYYHVFENRVDGPIYSPATGPIPGSRITTEMTMDSIVVLRDLDSNETETYTLVYPDRADIANHQLSVLAPIGTAILGYRVGDELRWRVPKGWRRLRVEQIPYQPERDETRCGRQTMQ